MSSSKGSNVYDDVDPMELVSDDEVVLEVQVITSDSESASDNNLDDFEPCALLGDIIDDDVLAIPPLLNDIVIMVHPEGEHIVEIIPFDVVPLDAIPFIVDLDDEDDVIPVIPVDHVDADLGDEEVHDVVVLDVASPMVSVMDISSDSETDSDASFYASITSSALQAVGLQRYPDFGDDIMPVEPVIPAPVQIPTPPHTPVHAPTDEPIHAPVSDGSTDCIRLMHFTPTSLPTRHPDEAGPSGHTHIQPGQTDPYYPPQVPVEHLATQHSPPHVMPTADPYHPDHYPSISTDDHILSLQLQIDILFTRLHELQQLTEARPPPPPPPAHSLPHAPPPPGFLPIDLRARVLTLEQQIDFLIR
ncbi:hypothetical protein Hdeb2414_s0013g00406571 [Helianthus debilis subsp. tardiflorus]